MAEPLVGMCTIEQRISCYTGPKLLDSRLPLQTGPYSNTKSWTWYIFEPKGRISTYFPQTPIRTSFIHNGTLPERIGLT